MRLSTSPPPRRASGRRALCRPPLAPPATAGWLWRPTLLTLLTLLVAFAAAAMLFVSCRSAPIVPGGAAKRAEALWRAGDDAAAAAAFEDRLAGGSTDLVIFQLALVYASPASAVHDPARSAELLRRLIDDYPKSRYRSSAAAVLALGVELERLRLETSSGDRETRRLRGRAAELQERIDKLTGQLEEMKRIDLERRRQPPG